MSCIKCIFCGGIAKFETASRSWRCDTPSCLVRGPNDDTDGTKWNTMMSTMESYRFTAPLSRTPQVAKDLPFELPPVRQKTVYVDDEQTERDTFASAVLSNAHRWLMTMLKNAGVREIDLNDAVGVLFREADDVGLVLKMISTLPAEDDEHD